MGNMEVAHNWRIPWAPRVLPARGSGGILPQKILKFGCSEMLFLTVLRGRFLSKIFAKSIVIWVSGSGRSKGGLPFIFRPKWGPKGWKNSFGRPPPPPYLRVWMRALPPPPSLISKVIDFREAFTLTLTLLCKQLYKLKVFNSFEKKIIMILIKTPEGTGYAIFLSSSRPLE